MEKRRQVKRTALREKRTDGVRALPIEIDARALRRDVLAWYGRRARALPWRQTKDPYSIWVSEVMLQQTQVATVIPYFKRFLQAFPTVRHLAQAPAERLLRLWSGLGYYRRARDLQRAAQLLVRNWNGELPRDERALCSLPGVGRYTARAILSIAWNHPYTVLDGNIARVAARLTASHGIPTTLSFRRRLERKLNRLLSQKSPGRFNQALMELGQTVCLPRAPRCSACPLRTHCRACRTPNPEAYPAARPRRRTEATYLASAILCHNGQVVLVKGLDEKLLRDLWNFPAAFGKTPQHALARLQMKLHRAAGRSLRVGPHLGSLKHQITYRSIQVELYLAAVEAGALGRSFRWFPLLRLDEHAISQLARKVAAALLKPTPVSASQR